MRFLILLLIMSVQGLLNTTLAATASAVKADSIKRQWGYLPVPGLFKTYPSAKELNQMLADGSKLTFNEKLILRVLKWNAKSRILLSGEPTVKQRKLGRLSLIFGLSAFVLALIANIIPVLSILALLSIPSAIAGLVLGIQSVKGNSNTEGVLGLIISGAFLALLILGLAFLLLFFSAGWI